MKVTTHNIKETYRLAAQIGKKLKPGQVIALSGDLGAGKTTFVKGLAKSLGIKESITSPTFVLLKNYTSRKIKNFVHVDLYRLESIRDLQEIGLLNYIGAPDTLTIIEWAEKFLQILPKAPGQTIRIKIKNSPASVTERFFEITNR